MFYSTFPCYLLYVVSNLLNQPVSIIFLHPLSLVIPLCNQTSGTLSHWLMPYKVKRGNVSFQCGTLSQKRLQVQHLVLKNQTSGTLSHWLMPYKVERGKVSL